MAQKICFVASVLFLLVALVFTGIFFSGWVIETDYEDPGEAFGAGLGRALTLIISFFPAVGGAVLCGLLSIVNLKSETKWFRILSRSFLAISVLIICVLLFFMFIMKP